MTPDHPDQRRYACPACGCADMIAHLAPKLPILPFVYTCPRCKAVLEPDVGPGAPPVQPTDPAARMTLPGIDEDAVA